MSPSGRSRRLLRSVRFRVTAVAVAVVAVVLLVLGIGVVQAQRDDLTASVDDRLEAEAERIVDRVDERDGFDDGGEDDELTLTDDDDLIAQVVDGSGAVVAGSDEAPPARLGGPLGEDDDERFESADVLDSDDEGDVDPWRVLVVPADDGLTVVVAAATDDLDESVSTLVTSLVVALPLALLVLAVVIWWLVGRTLRPVEAMRAEVAAMDGSDLSRRVPEPGTGDEVDRLAGTMNAMLGRVEQASAEQRRFVGDASHELRSPLARMRTELEVDVAHPEGADPVATRQSVLDEVVGLQGLVEDLLLLARSDSASVVVRRDRVDLGDLVLDEAQHVRRAGVTVDSSAVAPVAADGDRGQLVRVVRNLLENAVRHARTAVVLSLVQEGSEVVLTVDDDGPGIPPEQRTAVFERFTRLDEARTAGQGGAGLGLAIVRDVVHRHGGAVTAGASPAGGARLEVRLPS